MSGNLLHINKTYNRIKKRDVIDTPKTENSVRTINITNFLKEEVQEYAKKHYGFPEDQRLFPIVASLYDVMKAIEICIAACLEIVPPSMTRPTIVGTRTACMSVFPIAALSCFAWSFENCLLISMRNLLSISSASSSFPD